MWIRKKALVEAIRGLTEEIKELEQVKREHEELEDLITWLNDWCEKENIQICGLRKIMPDDDYPLPRYIGFVISSSVNDLADGSYLFAIRGYLSPSPCFGRPDYFAQVTQSIHGLGSDVKNTLVLTENRVNTEIRRKGVGSAGLTMIKELAKHLRCSEVTGTKRVETFKFETEEEVAEEYEHLTAFYAANGFEQEEGSRKITYNMRRYKEETEQKRWAFLGSSSDDA